MLLVTGPVTKNMREALERTYAATPDAEMGGGGRRLRAIDGGVFAGSYACVGPVSAVIPVDLTIPGCPPPPVDILKGLLRLIEGTHPKPAHVRQRSRP